jgi:GntR family transcriptional regulator
VSKPQSTTPADHDTGAEETLLPWSKPDQQNPLPLYYQIYQLYKQRILSGSLKRGDKLPSESAQEAAYGISRITARRAMDELARDELVTRERGRGTIVSYAMPSATVAADFTDFMDTLIAIGESTHVEVLSFDYVAAPANVVDALQLQAGDSVQRAERKRSKQDKPLSYSISYLPESIGCAISVDNLSDQPVLALIERAGHSIAEAQQSVTAIVADSRIASVLEVPVGSALLNIKRVVKNDRGEPLQLIEVYYRPDQYQLNMRLARSKSRQRRASVGSAELTNASLRNYSG